MVNRLESNSGGNSKKPRRPTDQIVARKESGEAAKTHGQATKQPKASDTNADMPYAWQNDETHFFTL